MTLSSRLRAGLALLDISQFALAFARCPFCGPSAFVRLNDRDYGVRCLRCAATAVHVAMGQALHERVPDLAIRDVCELSARGPLVDHLRRCARSVALSEYFPDAVPGQLHDGVHCQDVQQLTYADASFDLVTHTEVLEHVPDDRLAFSELCRVLRPGGLMLFTVPLTGSDSTLERARLRNGAVEHLQTPVFHSDPLRAGAGILAFRDYGYDILGRLRAAGFADARLHAVRSRLPWLTSRDVIVAYKEHR